MLKKIRIQRVSIFDIVATLVLAVVLVAFAVQGTGELAQMQTATDDYIQCETLARQLQSGSDYLIEQVRMYTATGQREYMDNYFEELNTTAAARTLRVFCRALRRHRCFHAAEIRHDNVAKSELYGSVCHAACGAGHAGGRVELADGNPVCLAA